ncbi:DNA polymerase I [Rhodocytophaga rosea]|uniref:DNA polymerase I n=1 Tax=Rhodocytophaga rosea TaxID=2704465 RepID=A0A6C0GPP5_9BACT|nr:DNA polymerase I [Rhodocytophaga rosea]QHT69814.1 DNA polymerase I [Rhodocytophaga rosea]
MSKPIHKLFLLDAYALIYRAHFAFSKAPRITSKGMNTSAIFGFTNTLLEVLQKEKPTHIGVAFDTAAPTFRHTTYTEYKSQRQAQPEDITIAVPYVKKLVKAFGIPVLAMDGFEADDVIGTIAKRAAREGFEVFMMTPDKDYGQLVEEHVYLYKPAFMGKGVEILGEKEILQKWGIKRIDQVIDMLGLQGDAVDNIPGIPGVGEKTAQKLIEEFDTVENLIANATQLKGKQKDNVEQYAQQALLSKQLATIDINVPVPFEADELKCREADKVVLSELLDELEFRTIKKRLFGEEPVPGASAAPKAAAKKTNQPEFSFELDFNPALLTETAELPPSDKASIHTVLHQYHVIDTPELRKLLIEHLSRQDEFCFDSETNSIDAVAAELVGLAFSYYKNEAYYVPIPADQKEAQAIVNEFKPVLENPAIGKIGQNLKYDIIVLKNYGVQVRGKIFDTMLAHYLLEPDMRHNMDILAETYLHYQTVSIESLIGKKGKDQITMDKVEIEKIAEYAGEDADITLQLKEVFLPKLRENKMEKLFYEIENPLVPVLAEMERTGVKVDTVALGELSKILEGDLKGLEDKIFTLSGTPFNIGSPKQLGEVLFDQMKLDPKAKKTKTGQYATGEDILSKLEGDHEIIRHILDYRELQKLKSTYIDALPILMSPKDGRIHTSYNQAVTATGRLSSTNPNLQNIPIRTERGREIRKAFVPHNESFTILSADYSQIELRIMAAFSQDQTMLDAFQKGIDIHTSTASKVFKVDLKEVTSDMRRKAKTINFGIIYGISAFGLGSRLNIPRKEAGEIIDAYFQEFPAVKKYMDSSIQKARDCEYAETLLGRRRYLRDINSRNMTDRNFAERNAINAPIQGTAADMIKIAMIRIHEYIEQEKLQSRMILQVHDELVFDAHKDEVETLKTQVEDIMKHALPLGVPMEIGIGTGNNWLEAH